MEIDIVTKRGITKLLNNWYQSMLSQQVTTATNLKKDIDEKIEQLKNVQKEIDQNVLLYYSLLEFRYKVLTDSLSITKESFDVINSYNTPSDKLQYYYYHLFKAIHATVTTNYKEASEYFEKAKRLLMDIPNALEKAEFYYRVAVFYYQFYRPIKSIEYALKAKEIFAYHEGYEKNVAACQSVLGASSVYLHQYEQAEDYYNSAIRILQKENEESLLLRVRNNLGWLYGTQNFSTLAIRQLYEVTTKMPKHFKAIFLQAREHYKLGENVIANDLIERGLNICVELGNKEYVHHYAILKGLNQGISIEELEKIILAGITYFDKELLYNYTQEYAEILAKKFYNENHYQKAAKYFLMSLQVKEKTYEGGGEK
ncbi:hypothetical protein AAIE21_25105 [Paenibacillus sp. 102]|uniref:response regulator aspartate phosphatase n=1 Tax=Paenibacillus sp. 102 TaxID=3120823 RepID=UPI0031BA7069